MNVTVMFVFFFALDLKHVFSGKVADRAAGSSAKDEAAPLCLNSSSKTRLLHVFFESIPQNHRGHYNTHFGGIQQ